MRADLSSNMPIITFAIITIFCGAFTIYHSPENLFASGQLQPNSTRSLPAQLTEPMGVKITSPLAGQEVPIGELNISGTSTDNAATNCDVFVDVNDIKPLQKTRAVGPGGEIDYSNWTYTYTKNYHLITVGPNELTAKLSCSENLENTTGGNSIQVSNSSNGKSKWYSINVTGIAVPSLVDGDQSGNQTQTESVNASKQNATVSENMQDKVSNSVSEPMPPNNIKHEIAEIPEDEVSVLDVEGSSPQVLQSQDRSSQEEESDGSNFPSSDHLNEESGKVMKHFSPSDDLSTVGSPSDGEGQHSYGPRNQEEFQQSTAISDLRDPSDDASQSTEETQGIDSDDADSWLVPAEDRTVTQTNQMPVQDTDSDPSLEPFAQDNQKQAGLEEKQLGQEDDNDEDRGDETQSANDMYEMIVGGFEEQVDTDEVDTDEVDTEEVDTEEVETDIMKTAQNIHDGDPENTIAEEIPLMRSYTRDIESALD